MTRDRTSFLRVTTGAGEGSGPEDRLAREEMAGEAEYHFPTRNNMAIARSAARENQMIRDCPKGAMMAAANRGPSALPALPPTWNSDSAIPLRPPEARKATREDSGWKTAEPSPTRQTHNNTIGRLSAR